MGRRKDLSLAKKIAVLSAHQEEKKMQTELAWQFGISQPQVSKIIKDKEALKDGVQEERKPEQEEETGEQGRRC